MHLLSRRRHRLRLACVVVAVLFRNDSRQQLVAHGLHFLEALVYGNLAHVAHLADIGLGYVQPAVLAHEIDDAGGDRVRGVVVDEVALLQFSRDEFGHHDQFRRHGQFAAVSLDKRARRGRAQIVGRGVRVAAALDVVEDGHRHGASARGARLVEMEDLGDFVGGARAAVQAAGDVDGGGLDAVAVEAAEHLLAADVFVDDHRVVDEDFGDARVLGHDGYELELVVQRLLAVRHRLPLDPLPDLLHLVGTFRRAEHFAAVGRLLQQRVDRVAAAGGVVGVLVLRAEVAPLGGIVEHGGVHESARGRGAGGEPVLHDHERRLALRADLVGVRLCPRVGLVVHALDGPPLLGALVAVVYLPQLNLVARRNRSLLLLRPVAASHRRAAIAGVHGKRVAHFY